MHKPTTLSPELRHTVSRGSTVFSANASNNSNNLSTRSISTSFRGSVTSNQFLTADAENPSASTTRNSVASSFSPRRKLAEIFPLRISRFRSFWQRNLRPRAGTISTFHSNRTNKTNKTNNTAALQPNSGLNDAQTLIPEEHDPMRSCVEFVAMLLSLALVVCCALRGFSWVNETVFCAVGGTATATVVLLLCVLLHHNMSWKHLLWLVSTPSFLVVLALMITTVVTSFLYDSKSEFTVSVVLFVMVWCFVVVMDVALHVSWWLRIVSTVLVIVVFSVSLVARQVSEKNDHLFWEVLGIPLWTGAVVRSTYMQVLFLGLRAVYLAFMDKKGEVMSFVQGHVLCSEVVYGNSNNHSIAGVASFGGYLLRLVLCISLLVCAVVHLSFSVGWVSNKGVVEVLCAITAGVCCFLWAILLAVFFLSDVVRHMLVREIRVCVGFALQVLVVVITLLVEDVDTCRMSTLYLVCAQLLFVVIDSLSCNRGAFRVTTVLLCLFVWLCIVLRHVRQYDINVRLLNAGPIHIAAFPTLLALDVQMLTIVVDVLWVVVRDPYDSVFNIIQRPYPKEEMGPAKGLMFGRRGAEVAFYYSSAPHRTPPPRDGRAASVIDA